MLVSNLDIVQLGGSSVSVGSLVPLRQFIAVLALLILADISPMPGASAKTAHLCCMWSPLLSSSSRWPGLIHIVVTGFKEQEQGVPNTSCISSSELSHCHFHCIHSMGQSRAQHQHKFKAGEIRIPLTMVGKNLWSFLQSPTGGSYLYI